VKQSEEEQKDEASEKQEMVDFNDTGMKSNILGEKKNVATKRADRFDDNGIKKDTTNA